MVLIFSQTRNLPHLKYADDGVLLNVNPSKLQLPFGCLNSILGLLGMHFARSKCEMLVQDWIGCRLNLNIDE